MSRPNGPRLRDLVAMVIVAELAALAAVVLFGGPLSAILIEASRNL